MTDLNAHVVLGMSLGPGSAKAGRTKRVTRKGYAIPGDRRQEARVSKGWQTGGSLGW
jgi:hypothetical protein